MASKRTDAERRVRQTDRLARVLRVLQLIQGTGPTTAQSIARELECSERTVYRDLQTLAAAGVPWFFDEYAQSYRTRDGYKGSLAHFSAKPRGDGVSPSAPPLSADDARSIVTMAKDSAQRLLTEAESVIQALDRLTKAMEDMAGPFPK